VSEDTHPPHVGGASSPTASASRSAASPSPTDSPSPANHRTKSTPSRPKTYPCSSIDVRCATKECPFCSLERSSYGFEKHLKECPDFDPHWGPSDDPDVLKYLSSVRARVFCLGCDRWFQGHKQAKNIANHAQSCSSESDQVATI
jgi:hypothetical protein